MALKYVKSRKGRDQLLHEGYRYQKERESKSKVVWKCADYRKSRCPGRAHTCHGKLVHSLPHNHPPPAKTASMDAETCGEKEKASSSQEPAGEGPLPGRQASPGLPASRKPRIQNDPKLTIQLLRARLNAARQAVSDLRRASSVAETVPAHPPSPASLDSPGRSAAFEDTRSEAVPVPGNGTNTSRSPVTRSSREAARQRFRLGCVPPTETPQETLSWLSKAAEQWLRPRQHSKDQIVDMVILEQFLNMLPGDLQASVRAREPGSSKEALQLVESYFREEEPANSVQDLVTFEDVSVRFTEEEWALLGQKEKSLYWNVTRENYDNVAWLGDGTNRKSREEDPWLAVRDSVAIGKPKEAFLQSPEQDLLRENCLEREAKTNSGGEREKDVLCWRSSQKVTSDMVHPERETDCEAWDDSLSAFIKTQESPSEESPELMAFSGKSGELSEKKILQDLQENLFKEDQCRIPSHSGKEDERSTLLRNSLRDPLHPDSRPHADAAELKESLRLDSNQKIHSREDPEYVALNGESLETSVDKISQISAKQDLQSKPMQLCSKPILAEANEPADLQHKLAHVYSEVSTTESSEACSQGSGCKDSDSVVGDQNVLESHHTSISGNDGRQEKYLLSGNGRELSKDMLQLDAGPEPEKQDLHTGCVGQDQCSKNIGTQDMAHGEDQYKSPKSDRQFTQKSGPAGQTSCSDSGKKPRDLLAVMKRRRLYRRRKYFSGENMHTKSVPEVPQRIQPAGKLQKHLDWKEKGYYKFGQCRLVEPGRGLRQPLKDHLQTREALHRTSATTRVAGSSLPNPRRLKPEPISPLPRPLYKMVAEPTLAQFMALLEQVAADAVEIKSAVSHLHTSVTAIHSALGSLSGCSSKAELRISDLEDTSRNTKAQLMKQCNDIKAIEAKLVEKAVQTNVIAGLWSSLRGQREATALHWPPK